MGCLGSKEEAPPKPRQPRYVPPEHTEQPPAPQTPNTVVSQPQPITPATGGPKNPRQEEPQNQYGTSTERRDKEVEFYNKAVSKADAEFIDVLQSALDFENDEDEMAEEQVSQLRAVTVDDKLAKPQPLPKPSAGNADAVAALLSAPALSRTRMDHLLSKAADHRLAANDIRIDDRGQRFVVQFGAA